MGSEGEDAMLDRLTCRDCWGTRALRSKSADMKVHGKTFTEAALGLFDSWWARGVCMCSASLDSGRGWHLPAGYFPPPGCGHISAQVAGFRGRLGSMSRDVCQHCVQAKRGLSWTSEDDRRWEAGKVLCPVQVNTEGTCGWGDTNRWLCYTRMVPPHCGCALEHLVLGQGKKPRPRGWAGDYSSASGDRAG